MKIELENLGVLKKAEFELGDFTLICGSNNTGKTYATYALFGFLWHWERLLQATVSSGTVQDLLRDGVTRLDIESYAKEAKQILKKGCQEYTSNLPRIFASEPGRFEDSRFQVSIETDTKSKIRNRAFKRTIRSAEDDLLSITKAKGGKRCLCIAINGEARKRVARKYD